MNIESPALLSNSSSRSESSFTSNKWIICNKSFPKGEVVYFSQILLVYIVAVTCIVNLSLDKGNQYIWSNLLSACVAYMIPAPRIKNSKEKGIRNESLLPNTS